MEIGNIYNKLSQTVTATLLTLGLTGCMYEDTPGSGVQQLSQGYISVKVSMTTIDGSRADEANFPDYQYGSEYEHALDMTGSSDNVLIFFDSQYRYVGYAELTLDDAHLDNTKPTDPIEATYTCFIRPASQDDVDALPDYGLIVLNGTGLTGSLEALINTGAGVPEVLALVDRGSATHNVGRSGHYFTMTSSAYVSEADGEWRHSILFEINKDNIYHTKQEAVVGAPVATATVERMVSKFSIAFTGADDETGTHYSPTPSLSQVIVCTFRDGMPNFANRKWTCNVTGWEMNASEQAAYFFKNIVGSNTNTTTYPYVYGTDISTSNMPFFNGWNRQGDCRSFWAVDANYDSGLYPQQYRPAVDDYVEIDHYGKSGDPTLCYKAYNEMAFIEDGGAGAYIYVPENTFPDTRVEGRSWQHNFMSTEVLVGALLHIEGVDETDPDYDLFRNRTGIFYPSKTDLLTYFVNTVNDQLQSHSTMTYRFYDWDSPENNLAPSVNTLVFEHGDYRLYYKDAPLTLDRLPEVLADLERNGETFYIPAQVRNGDGKVIPWIPGVYIARQDADPDSFELIGGIERYDLAENVFKSLIFDWIGTFDHFNGGRMYYSTPIRHNVSLNKASQTTYRPVVGDFGVVRNHWYKLEVQSIDNIGIPVDDPNQKILPYHANLDNSILIEIRILNWHEFVTTVVLPGSLD